MITRGEEDLNVIWELSRNPHFLPPVRIEDPKIVLDLGCWIGFTTRRYAELWPGATIIACDADRDNADLARENTKEFDNVTVYNAAVGIPGQGSLSDVSKNRRTLKGGDPGTIVEVISVDTLLKAASVTDPIDFCKMDIEGAELDVLRGRWIKSAKQLLIDVHIPGVARRLFQLGFAISTALPSDGYEEQYWAWRR